MVPLRDIEARWAKQANAQVLDNLRSIAAQNQGQLLSFDRYAAFRSTMHLQTFGIQTQCLTVVLINRFCLALKMALLAESPKSSCNNSVSSVTSGGSAPSNNQNQGPPKNTPLDNVSLPLLIIRSPIVHSGEEPDSRFGFKLRRFRRERPSVTYGS